MLAAEPCDLGGGYELLAVPPEAFAAEYGKLEELLFGGAVYDLSDLPRVPLPERQQFTYFIKQGEQVVGLHRSCQRDEHTVHMSVTGILPEHRRQGLYRRLIPQLLRLFSAAGFTFVTSTHHPTNNAVIIPKLKAGFVIQGMQMTRAGVMVQLLYSFNEPYLGYLAALCGHRSNEFLQT